MTLDELMANSTVALDELTRELFSRGHAEMQKDPQSQLTACLLLAIRSASILHGMERLLQLHTIDSFEVLNRAEIEARDLLMYFRFDDNEARDKIKYWFAGKPDASWKANYTKLESFLTEQGATGLSLASNWSKLSVLAHPTKYAAENSAVCIVNRMIGATNGLLDPEFKKADYVIGISRLILAVTSNPSGWIPLVLDPEHLPISIRFMQDAEEVAVPILNAPIDHPLPDQSIRQPKRTR